MAGDLRGRGSSFGRAVKPLFQSVREAVDALIPCVDRDMRYVAVEWVTIYEKLRQLSLRVIGPQQRPITIMTRSMPQILRGGSEVDHNSILAQGVPVLGGQHSTAAGSQYYVGLLGKASQHFGFAQTEPGFAFDFEYDGYADAGGAFDLMVAVKKKLPEPAREKLADRCLAGPHQTY
jgi:hypothetical protein